MDAVEGLAQHHSNHPTSMARMSPDAIAYDSDSERNMT